MLRSNLFVSKSIPGYGQPDGIYLPSSGVSARAVSMSPSSSRGECRLISDVNNMRASRSISFVCNASSSNYRRNSDFSRQNKHGFSRNRNRHGDERDGFEDFEDSDSFSSKNGPLLSDSGNYRKGQTTAAPGLREKEIVELFRKVQAQLRERTAMKEEKKVEESPIKSKESETVDSLLKLLRKHSVQQGKKNTSNASTSDFILDRSKALGSSKEENSGSVSNDSERSVKHEKQAIPSPVVSRPRSNFQKRSPVPEIKFKPIFPEGESPSYETHDTLDGGKTKKGLKLEPDDINDLDTESVVDPLFPEGEEVFDEMSEDEIFSSDETEEEQNQIDNLGEMKLVELRALAKSRGLKGFSKLKKNELVELLSRSST